MYCRLRLPFKIRSALQETQNHNYHFPDLLDKTLTLIKTSPQAVIKSPTSLVNSSAMGKETHEISELSSNFPNLLKAFVLEAEKYTKTNGNRKPPQNIDDLKAKNAKSVFAFSR